MNLISAPSASDFGYVLPSPASRLGLLLFFCLHCRLELNPSIYHLVDQLYNIGTPLDRSWSSLSSSRQLRSACDDEISKRTGRCSGSFVTIDLPLESASPKRPRRIERLTISARCRINLVRSSALTKHWYASLIPAQSCWSNSQQRQRSKIRSLSRSLERIERILSRPLKALIATTLISANRVRPA